MKILITGASGFIGRALLDKLHADGSHDLVTSVRGISPELEKYSKCHSIGNIDASTRWDKALGGVDVIVHCAARVHVGKEEYNESLAKFREVNVKGTLNLAQQAVKYGVGRFIFISSIGVNGNNTKKGKAFTAEDKPAPVTPYGISKMEAEQGLLAVGKETGMEIVIIRPPLVYGAGAKGNVAAVAKMIESGFPLPFGTLRNKRSMVHIDNLIDMISVCLAHKQAAGQIFLVSDDKDISTTELFRHTAKVIGKRANLLPFPSFLLKLLLKIAGKGDIAKNICGNLEVDISKTKNLLGWTPSRGYKLKEIHEI